MMSGPWSTGWTAFSQTGLFSLFHVNLQVYVNRRWSDTVVVLILIVNMFYVGSNQGLLNFRVEN